MTSFAKRHAATSIAGSLARRTGAFAFLLLAGRVVPARAQVFADLYGTVRDQAGAGVSGAAVTAKGMDTGVTRSVVTDTEGRYQSSSLPVGQYELRSTKPGFHEECERAFAWR